MTASRLDALCFDPSTLASTAVVNLASWGHYGPTPPGLTLGLNPLICNKNISTTALQLFADVVRLSVSGLTRISQHSSEGHPHKSWDDT